jgi:hypothetical protein
MTKPNHMFVSDNGALYDTRDADWSANPLRSNYSRHHREIRTVADLKATLRAGEWAWPGGYPLYFVTSDGGALSFDTVKAELFNVIWEIQTETDGGWRVVGCDINYEDGDLVCDHSGDPIESAYGDRNMAPR